MRAIIFDFDGTIADTEGMHYEATRKVLEEEDLLLTREVFYERYLGYDDLNCFRTLLKDENLPVEEDRIQNLAHRKARYYQEYFKHHLILFPGVVGFIRKVAEKYVMAIASGALQNEIEFALEIAQIRDRFKIIISAEDVEHSKPHPQGFLKALKKINQEIMNSSRWIRPAECLVIEDSIAGVKAARSAQMKCLAVLNTYSEAELKSAGADL
ncbi:MAG: HAD family phosphatase, partial [Nitrospira sp.]|nr:HAD family phosphatase [Nitrospira sp.]